MTGRADGGSNPDRRSTMWARTGVALATRALPAGPTRDRWRQEFRADLQVLGRRRQATYTVGVLANAWALRSAVDGERVDAPGRKAPMKDLRCLAMWHKYVEKRSPDGSGAYVECRRCGYVKDKPDGRETMGWGAGA